MSTSGDPIVGRVIDGRYEVRAVIARGGMSTVYEAVDTRLDRTVALKVMHRSFAEDPGFVRRFEREAKAAARLNHSNVVGVYDQGQYDGLIWLAMEYVPGHTLRDVVRVHAPLEADRALGVLAQVLRALTAAHGAGFVHRDIKPENVLMTSDGTMKVADFGLARALADDLGSAATKGVLIGTVAYLSPEQVESGEADERSDVYAAGVLLFELVTGRTPFTASTPLAVAYKHVNEQLPAPSSVVPDVPQQIDALVEHATRKNPAKRFQSADEFLAAVRRTEAELASAPGARSDARGGGPALGGDQGAAAVAPSRQPGGASPVHGIAAAAPAAAAAVSSPTTVTGSRPLTGAADGNGAGPQTTAVIAAGASADTSGATVVVRDSDVSHTAVLADGEAGGTAVIVDGGDDSAGPAGGGDVQRSRRVKGVGKLGRTRALIILVALAVVVALVGWWLGSLRYTPLPDVSGQTLTEAQVLLGQSDIGITEGEPQFSETVPLGIILATDPAPGTRVRQGSTITAVLSKGPERYEVPQLRGQSVADATTALQSNNLVLGGTQTEFDDEVPDGQVVGSTPAAGTPLKAQSTVTLIVSKGPAPVEVPDVVGLGQAEAVAALEQAGLVPNPTQALPVVVLGRVYSQDPAPGTTVPRGSTVTFTVV